jgi:hypothetical protein
MTANSEIIRGFIALILTIISIEEPTRNTMSMQRLADIDLAGSAIWSIAIVCLVLALSWGGSTYREYKRDM